MQGCFKEAASICVCHAGPMPSTDIEMEDVPSMELDDEDDDTNRWRWMHSSRRTLVVVTFDPLNPLWHPQYSSSRRRMVPFDLYKIIGPSMRSLSKIATPYPLFGGITMFR